MATFKIQSIILVSSPRPFHFARGRGWHWRRKWHFLVPLFHFLSCPSPMVSKCMADFVPSHLILYYHPACFSLFKKPSPHIFDQSQKCLRYDRLFKLGSFGISRPVCLNQMMEAKIPRIPLYRLSSTHKNIKRSRDDYATHNCRLRFLLRTNCQPPSMVFHRYRSIFLYWQNDSWDTKSQQSVYTFERCSCMREGNVCN
jgi:hypothetical protein